MFHIVDHGLSKFYRETFVELVPSFGRAVTGDDDLCDFDRLLIADKVEIASYFGKFRPVVGVIGVDEGFPDRELDECRPLSVIRVDARRVAHDYVFDYLRPGSAILSRRPIAKSNEDRQQQT